MFFTEVTQVLVSRKFNVSVLTTLSLLKSVFNKKVLAELALDEDQLCSALENIKNATVEDVQVAKQKFLKLGLSPENPLLVFTQ
jgi:hypothetical protein